jgi:hypothetical protein
MRAFRLLLVLALAAFVVAAGGASHASAPSTAILTRASPLVQRNAGAAGQRAIATAYSERARADRVSWRAVPVVGAASYTGLSSVSCASSRVCEAVGERLVGSGSRPYEASWNGSSWTSGAAPLPTGAAGAGLSSVSCPTTSYCVAVGQANSAEGSEAPLVEEWTSGAWHVGTLPEEERTLPYVILRSVSCTSPAFCLAVGDASSSQYGGEAVAALAYRWNGSQWSRLPAAPGDGAQTTLESVSCSAPDACTAVGEAGTARASAFVERWEGSAWTVERPPAPTGYLAGHSDFLSSVSCPLQSLCVAVGGALLGGADGSFAALQGIWHGSRWITQPRALLGPESVSCVAADCVAVGDTGSGGAVYHEATAERLDGGRWMITHPAWPSAKSALTGVSCSSLWHCFAVGWQASGGPETELIELYS